MTHPWPNPPQIPPGGPTTTPTRSGVFTVQLKPCCGLLPGDACSCAALAAEAASALACGIGWYPGGPR